MRCQPRQEALRAKNTPQLCCRQPLRWWTNCVCSGVDKTVPTLAKMSTEAFIYWHGKRAPISRRRQKSHMLLRSLYGKKNRRKRKQKERNKKKEKEREKKKKVYVAWSIISGFLSRNRKATLFWWLLYVCVVIYTYTHFLKNVLQWNIETLVEYSMYVILYVFIYTLRIYKLIKFMEAFGFT